MVRWRVSSGDKMFFWFSRPRSQPPKLMLTVLVGQVAFYTTRFHRLLSSSLLPDEGPSQHEEPHINPLPICAALLATSGSTRL